MCKSQARTLTAGLNHDSVKALFKTRPHLHALALAGNWMIIVSIMYLWHQFPILWLYPLAVIIIGTRMHALTVLMHDAAHNLFLKNRKWNDLISNMAIMYPIFTSIDKYRVNHHKHHAHLNTDHDPDWVAKLSKRAFTFPKTRSTFLWTLASYMVLYQGILDAIWFAKRYKGRGSKQKQNPISWSKTIFYLVLFSGLTILKLWPLYVFFWLIPYLTSFFMFQYIRSVAEHFGDLAYEDDLSSTRTVIAKGWERFLLAPHGVNYHIEHHLFPGVPFYNLPKLHKMLMAQTEYRSTAHITLGYTHGLLRELAT